MGLGVLHLRPGSDLQSAIFLDTDPQAPPPCIHILPPSTAYMRSQTPQVGIQTRSLHGTRHEGVLARVIIPIRLNH